MKTIVRHISRGGFFFFFFFSFLSPKQWLYGIVVQEARTEASASYSVALPSSLQSLPEHIGNTDAASGRGWHNGSFFSTNPLTDVLGTKEEGE